MSKNKYKIYHLKIPNGENVKVRYCPKYFYSNDELKYRIDHFEFLNCHTISETEFRSHFVNIGKLNYNPTRKEIIIYIKKTIEELTDLSYTKPTQAVLF